MRRKARVSSTEGSKDLSAARIKLIKYQIEIYGNKAKKFFKYMEKK
tara:strand:+ start:1149 stop:1286 length:138 start_codon:yes stop_codon:yes gene_type:complete